MSNTNASLFERGQAVIPGGVNSPVRAFGSVGGTPYFVERADGPFVYDVEGRRYIDYVQSYGPSILGHAHPDVIAAIRDAATRGTSYGAPTENEVRIAEERSFGKIVLKALDEEYGRNRTRVTEIWNLVHNVHGSELNALGASRDDE